MKSFSGYLWGWEVVAVGNTHDEDTDRAHEIPSHGLVP